MRLCMMHDSVFVSRLDITDMVNKIKYVYEWFPNRGTHSNITTQYRSKFYAKIKLYLMTKRPRLT